MKLKRGPDLVALFKAMPGLLDYYPNGVTAPLPEQLTHIRIYLANKGVLAFSAIEAEGVGSLDALASAINSSEVGRRSPSAAAAARLGIRTKRVAAPFWQIGFADAQSLKSLKVRLQRGVKGSNPAALKIELQTQTGERTEFSPGSPAALKGQLETFRSQWRRFSKGYPRLAALGDGFADAVARALDGRRGALKAASRAAFITQLFSYMQDKQGDELRRYLAACRRILPWLIDCRSKRAPGEVEIHDLQAIAMIFTSMILTKGRVPRRKVLNVYLALLIGSQEHLFVERLVGELYRRAGGDASAEPIMFRKHGLRGSSLIREAPIYLNAMQEIEELFRKLGYDACLHYGTLLGAVREHAFIPHDDDVDMAIVLRSVTAADIATEAGSIVKGLAKAGIRAKNALHGGLPLIQVKCPEAKKVIDVFCMAPTSDDGVRMHMERLKPRSLPARMVIPFGSLTFYGRTFKCPADSPGVLAERYGADWMTPRRWVSRSKSIDAAPPASAVRARVDA
ncbi:LicD family protein [Hansschlegelia plantiphila]|uniref:LicD/FKTN/FKRP nucleotidyltransferase domain-containing protein n=1 Tax=Hansschlegelia plantiphila TaxID=374655 RepID=A0A9W6MUG5_9HYPH|nr:LicD family protein [Hansschlegelia plantiphila]GLK66927.1 hypothetical protein GCM10008179_05650 [Hansschlegelia plantiphila]